MAITDGARAGPPSPGAQASFPGHLATRRLVEVGTVDPVIAEQLGRDHPLARHLDDFLTHLANAGASAHTRRAFRGDLIAFAAHHGEEIAELTAMPIHAYGPSSRSYRRPAASASAPPSLPSPSGRSATTS